MSELSRNTHGGEIVRYINLKLAALGQPTSRSTADPSFLEIARSAAAQLLPEGPIAGGPAVSGGHAHPGFSRRLSGGRSVPAARRGCRRIRSRSTVPGWRAPCRCRRAAITFASPYLKSYRVAQGVLHNPKSDRRTTQGLFHIVEGGLPVPADKSAVPKRVFARFLAEALRPPADADDAAVHRRIRTSRRGCFVSLLLRPVVCPATGRGSGEDDGDPLLRAGQPGEQPRFRRDDLRQRRRSLPAGERRGARRAALDRPHAAA